MEITDVQITLAAGEAGPLRAFARVVIDGDLVVEDVRVVEGQQGLFVAMPVRVATVSCPQCRGPNRANARFCNECGRALPPQQLPPTRDERFKLYHDVAHPVTPECRRMIHDAVVRAYRAALEAKAGPKE